MGHHSLQIVIVHGGVRESQPGYSESQIAIWSMLFSKIPVTSKYVITDHPYVHAKSSSRSAIHNSAKETGHK